MPEKNIIGIEHIAYKTDSHMPIRVTRRITTSLPPATASETRGITAAANPEPIIKNTKKKVVPRTAAASSVTPYQPTIIVSIK